MDKLISAEHLKNMIKANCNPYGKPTLDFDTSLKIMELIDNMFPAFDKEKVIEELTELRQREYKDNEEEEESFDGEEIYDAGRSQGRFEAYHKAIEIVEKGGV